MAAVKPSAAGAKSIAEENAGSLFRTRKEPDAGAAKKKPRPSKGETAADEAACDEMCDEMLYDGPYRHCAVVRTLCSACLSSAGLCQFIQRQNKDVRASHWFRASKSTAAFSAGLGTD